MFQVASNVKTKIHLRSRGHFNIASFFSFFRFFLIKLCVQRFACVSAGTLGLQMQMRA